MVGPSARKGVILRYRIDNLVIEFWRGKKKANQGIRSEFANYIELQVRISCRIWIIRNWHLHSWESWTDSLDTQSGNPESHIDCLDTQTKSLDRQRNCPDIWIHYQDIQVESMDNKTDSQKNFRVTRQTVKMARPQTGRLSRQRNCTDMQTDYRDMYTETLNSTRWSPKTSKRSRLSDRQLRQ